MKTTVLSILLIVLSLTTKLFSQSPFYYYAYNEQIYLVKTSNKAVVKFKEETTIPDFNSFLQDAGFNLSNITIEKINSRTFIVTYNSIESLINSMNQLEYVKTAESVFQTDEGMEVGITDEIVIKLKEGVNSIAADNFISSLGLSTGRISFSYTLLICPSKSDVLSISNQLAISGYFKFAHPNFIAKASKFYYPNDPYFNYQWGLHNTGQTINDGHSGSSDADVDAPEAWDITKGSPNITIAVLDDGVTDAHPDLPSSRQVRLNGSNFVAPYDGSDPNDPSPAWDGNHGNCCAGVIAATMDNNEGITGIAPLCRIMPVRVPVGISAPQTDFADAINFAWQNGADIISCSWGFTSWNPNFSPVVKQAIEDATNNGRSGLGTVVVFATGNTANHVLGVNGFVTFPSNVLVDGVLTVGASDRYDLQSNYSPTSNLNLINYQNQVVDLTAPSHRAYSCQISTETFEVWSLDYPGQYNGYNEWPFPGDCGSLPIQTEQLPSSGTNYLSYTGRFGGTSAATPLVAGIAALVLSVNPCLSQLQVFDILTNTADKVGGYAYQNGYSLELGHGRVNAFNAVNAAVAMYNTGLDVYTKDTPYDWGTEPNPDNGPMWISDDIWVRNVNDGGTEHQNPEYWINPTVDNYIYVRVRNKSCTDFISSSSDLLHLHWAKAASALSWPDYWYASSGITCNGGPPMGDEMPSSPQQIPDIPAGGEAILVFPWHVPDPALYNGCNPQPWHFCLLSRIDSPQDPMTFAEVASVYDNARNNNNIAWKNVTVVDLLPGIAQDGECLSDRVAGGTIAIGNPSNDREDNYKLEFKLDDSNRGIPIFEQAEIKLTLDDLSWQKWLQGGQQQQNIHIKREDCHQLVITGNPAYLNNLAYDANERSTMHVSFNFLIDKADATPKFDYHVIQKRTEDEKIIGGELYRIRKPQRDHFSADAGSDEAISQGASKTLSATGIGESAYYNWYDPDGNLIYSGNNFIVTPEITTKYKLEVIALSDGFASYDSVTVKIKDCEIQSITPNPATTQITVQYKTENVSSGYLVITHPSGTPNDNYILNLSQNTKIIDVSNYSTGNYNMILVCDGEIKDQKVISIQ